MNDELKELLIDLVDYYNEMGTDKDPGIRTLENIVQRASVVLEVQHRIDTIKSNRNSADVDPYAMDVVGKVYKNENDF